MDMKTASPGCIALHGRTVISKGFVRMTDNTTTVAAGAVTGGVRILLRLEGLGLFALCVLLYANSGLSWTAFAILFFAPDVSFLVRRI
ncbi:hypothetical protein V1291_005487 [Nitrobacteraceae bacterium AZCC 1564]